jgi:predicted MFS family arabinose efflux permease
MKSHHALTLNLGVSQTLAWASSYYLPAVLAESIARDMNMSTSAFFAAFSLALIVSAAVGPFSGRLIDLYGGRPVLMASNFIFAMGLGLLSQVQNSVHVFAAWAIVGIAMGSGLYESAFATVVRLKGGAARNVITGITLLAGLASTVGWPLTAYVASSFGWREACLTWAVLHLLFGLPMNALLPRWTAPASTKDKVSERIQAPLSKTQQHVALMLAYVFAASWFMSTAMAAHLPQLLMTSGVTFVLAISIAALVGPSQVLGRIFEFTLLKRAHPLLSARLATLAHPAACLALGLFGAPAAIAFAMIHGFGNGILTIAIGTLPLYFFGPNGYGQRQGLLMVPARIIQAFAPLMFGVMLETWATGALWLSAGLGLSAFGVLMVLKAPASSLKA